jgi:hypothetical protein
VNHKGDEEDIEDVETVIWQTTVRPQQHRPPFRPRRACVLCSRPRPRDRVGWPRPCARRAKPDVVDAQDVGAALDREDGGRVPRPARPGIEIRPRTPSAKAHEVAEAWKPPGAEGASCPRTSSEADARIDQALFGDPGRGGGGCARPGRRISPRGRHSGGVLHGQRSPACASGRGPRRTGHRPAMAGSKRSARVVDDIGPASSAAWAGGLGRIDGEEAASFPQGPAGTTLDLLGFGVGRAGPCSRRRHRRCPLPRPRAPGPGRRPLRRRSRPRRRRTNRG